MATIGSLVIGMSVQTGKLSAGLKSAERALQDFGQGGGQPGGRRGDRLVAKGDFSAGLAVGSAGAAGLGAFAYSMAKAIDETGDAADRLGTTTAALSELRYAAKLTGSEIEDLDLGLTKMNLNIGKAAQAGTKDGSDIFSKIGLDAQKLARMDPTQAFAAITAGMAGVKTEAERTAVAVEIFGKGGAKLLNTIKAGPADLAKFAAEFKTFGGSVSEVERQQVATMFDSFDRVGAVVKGLGTQLAVQFSPFITAAAEEFVALAGSGEGMGDDGDTALEGVALSVAKVADVTQGIDARLHRDLLRHRHAGRPVRPSRARDHRVGRQIAASPRAVGPIIIDEMFAALEGRSSRNCMDPQRGGRRRLRCVEQVAETAGRIPRAGGRLRRPGRSAGRSWPHKGRRLPRRACRGSQRPRGPSRDRR